MKKAEQREQTIRTLVASAREQFAERGYAGVALEDIVAAAGVTRGALYHHFDGKEGLFRAVLDDVGREVGAHIEAVADAEPDQWRALMVGCHAFLEVALDARIARIMLIDAPAVLGWETWRQIDEQNAMRLLREQLAALADAGTIHTPSVEALAHLLSGAMNELALWIAGSSTPEDTLSAALDALDAVLARLKG
ncbi:MAG: helix-turn-helix domain-containing protein [Chloroflexota bacterium]|nr:helix-turn-helix domain-containing protein [Chloroflexota bacterium]